jgi:PGM1 C-terminal domain/ATP-grasp domain
MTGHALHDGLAAAWSLNREEMPDEHVVIALPSFSIAPTIMSHYARRLPALEHRYLLSTLMLGRVRSCHLVFVCSRRPEPAVIDHYLALTGDPSARHRLHIVDVADESPRPIAAKLLDRPDLVTEIRGLLAGRPAFLEPWNVTDLEVAVSAALGVPAFGTSPDLWHLGFKSAGRALFARLGVPTPEGAGDIHDIAGVADVIWQLRHRRASLPGVVVKHDDSASGDGNMVVGLVNRDGRAVPEAVVRSALQRLPDWFRSDLMLGGVVEELICGAGVTSPSVQFDILPDGEVDVLSTHEQVLGRDDGQVYLGCRFPADPTYAPELARHARTVGTELARLGARGRVGIDFMARRRGMTSEVYALELNLRKGGTTHPYTALRNLVPGRYDVSSARWLADDGAVRCYSATDNLQHDGWVGLDGSRVLATVIEAGLAFNRETRSGVVLHMLSGLSVDGRLGLVAIAPTREEADALVDATEAIIETHLVSSRSMA